LHREKYWERLPKWLHTQISLIVWVASSMAAPLMGNKAEHASSAFQNINLAKT
jgi:hypothetical protein